MAKSGRKNPFLGQSRTFPEQRDVAENMINYGKGEMNVIR
jgi:hypothetical protein